jgi:hypothetical protein
VAVADRRVDLDAAVAGIAGRAQQLRAPLVEHRDPLLHAAERLHEIALEPDEDVDRVLVRATANPVRLALHALDDPAALLGRGLGQSTLLDEEGGLLLGSPDDPLRLLLGLLDDPLALRVDPLGGANLLRNRGPQLVDEPERRVLVDDDVVREGELLAVREERLEAFDEEDDVDRSALRCDGASARPDYRTRPGDRKRSTRARAAAGGTSDETSPPKPAISLARLELT